MGDVEEVLDTLYSDKSIAKATHNMYAYRFTDSNGLVFEANESDGEAKGGDSVAFVLRTMECMNVMCVLTRWYGGVKLGPGRFRIFKNVVRQAIIACEMDGKGK